MIKRISNKNILTTPFTAVKGWTLFNTISDDLVLLETNNFFVAFEYVNFYQTPPVLDRNCNIALQYNTNNDALVEEGIDGSGFFYPDTEPQNNSGTYKRLVYTQTAQAFYNTYNNPIQIFGMENIDFPLSRTNRNLGNQFLLFTIPQDIMGDKLVEGSIIMYDLFLDDNAVITDDKYGNLIIGRNLFSKIQEVRHIENIILDGAVNTSCPLPTGITTTTTTSTTTTEPPPTTTTTSTSTTTTEPPPTTTTTTTSTATTEPPPPPGDYFIAFRLTNPSVSCNADVTDNSSVNAEILDGTTVNFTVTYYNIPNLSPSETATLDLVGVADAFFSIGPALPGGDWDNNAISISHTRYSDGESPPCDVSSFFTSNYSYRNIYDITFAQYNNLPGTPAGTLEDPFIITVPSS